MAYLWLGYEMTMKVHKEVHRATGTIILVNRVLEIIQQQSATNHVKKEASAYRIINQSTE